MNSDQIDLQTDRSVEPYEPDQETSDRADSTWDPQLRGSPLMMHLLEALRAGTDVGHYGRLLFAIVARHFMDEDEIIRLLADQPGGDDTKARALLMQVRERDYNPPKRETILQWQAQQDFSICPDADDPAACNLYRELQFPDEVYQQIRQLWEQRAQHERS